MAVGGPSAGETSSRRFNSTTSFHKRRDMSSTSSLASMVSNAAHHQNQHAMLTAQSYYAAAIVNQTASRQLLVHHPDYQQHPVNHHSHHFNQTPNSISYQSNTSMIHSNSSVESNGHTNGNSDHPPDRPIGYGAFGVVWWVLRLLSFAPSHKQCLHQLDLHL